MRTRLGGREGPIKDGLSGASCCCLGLSLCRGLLVPAVGRCGPTNGELEGTAVRGLDGCGAGRGGCVVGGGGGGAVGLGLGLGLAVSGVLNTVLGGLARIELGVVTWMRCCWLCTSSSSSSYSYS